MEFDREGWKFDLLTQRFLRNRWETSVGRKVREEVIQGLKESIEVRCILGDYVLEHPSNIDPYGHPYYPPDAMQKNDFWLLTQDDLRGIRFYDEDFSNSPSFEKKSLSYSSFNNCSMNGADLFQVDLSYARLEECDLSDARMYKSGGFSTKLIKCTLKNACLWDSNFIDSDFSGTDLTGVYFEDAFLFDIQVNYLTKFDKNLKSRWRTRLIPPAQRADILRSIRIAYQKAELWHVADDFLFRERTENRKYVLWPLINQPPKGKNFLTWLKDIIFSFLSGYGTKPLRIIILSLFLSLIFAFIYFSVGTPMKLNHSMESFLEALYFSFTTFVTLGYGDISYGSNHPFMRMLSTGEAWCGAIAISIFVAALARKWLR